MLRWLGEWLNGLPAWGRVAVAAFVVLLLLYALFLGRDLTPIWGILGG